MAKIAIITPISHLEGIVDLLKEKGDIYLLEEGKKLEVRNLLLSKSIDVILCNPNQQTYKIDKELLLKEEQIKQQVKDKVVNYFNIDNFDFGEGLKIQDLNRAIFEIDDVRFSSIENLDNDIVLEFNEVLQLNNLTITVDLI